MRFDLDEMIFLPDIIYFLLCLQVDQFELDSSETPMKQVFNWERWYTKQVRIICHFLFWLLVTLMYYLGYSRLGNDYIWVFVAKELIATTSLFYTASWIIPKWITSGRVYLLPVFFLISYFWWIFCTYLTCQLVQNSIPETDSGFRRYVNLFLNDGFWRLFSFKNTATLALDFMTMVSIPLAPKLTKMLVENSNKVIRLERDHLAVELDFLKSQVSPHFLFNILNSIYSMSEMNHPDTSKTVLGLSDLMKYTVYQGRNESIPLSKEIDFIENYINLVQLRYGDRVPVKVNIDAIEEPYTITPLILITFIENAFKHGPDRSKTNAWVDISLTIQHDQLQLKVSNGVNPDAPATTIGGLGLSNAKRRLELHYPQKHELQISTTEKNHTINLIIQLK